MAGYVTKTLADDEEILFRANFNWTYSFFPTLWLALSLVPAGALLVFEFADGVARADLRVAWGFAAASAAAGALLIVNHLIVLYTTEIVVTTYRFVYKIGLISRNTQEVSLNKIEEITLRQSIFGRLLGYGQLVLRGTGVGVIELPDLDSPVRLRKIIENARSAIRQTPRGVSDLDGDGAP